MMDTAAAESAVRPYRELRTPPELRIPPLAAVLFGAALAAGLVTALESRRQPRFRRVLRGIHIGSTLSYLVAATLDLAEHFRLEKTLTGHLLRTAAIPPSESLVHAAIVATNASVLLLARPRRRPRRLRDRWLVIAPAVFLALGLCDELVFHRKRTRHREDILHTTQHLTEGIMWTTLYATRVAVTR